MPRRTQVISLERNGKHYRGEYSVERGRVTVEALSEEGGMARKTAQIGASEELTARILLRELIDAGRIIESQ